ncbi:AraC family transcriptional regulator [Pseudomonas sp. MAFF 302046]|jgi:AraC-like DNA-binding protein|uniref:AraC family transcriptional regulator n=1 Tax=Pseudomonas morbosilactucae TaxID=2938197 RepID=A0ABT0JAE9_9PSED|nr:AraC family transcriptional regulator [Pseudomonas morbosilactucae]MCK9812863.1 AraC family transcriptional regulator [Pseudomonas morbosilactucae]
MQDRHSPQDWVKHVPTVSSLTRFEAFFGAHAFDPHRHDTYAIGRTLVGVHRFHYRGESRQCLPGETMIVHPDEPHDGCAGSASGFRYRGVHLPPAVVQQILQGQPLPFFKAGVTHDPRLASAVDGLLDALDAGLDPLAEDEALYRLVTLFAEAAGQRPVSATPHYAAAARAREYLDDNLERPTTLDDLALCAGRDRWSLSKDFSLFFGTSPHRYLTLRRLDRVRALVMSGQALTEAAVAAGFFDHSHMARHFKKAFGIAPSRWCNPVSRTDA